jgi:hypothetical protein
MNHPRSTARHKGIAYLGGAAIFFVLSGMLMGMPGDYWPTLLPAFGFSVAGWTIARRRSIRLVGILLSGLTGGALLGDLVAWLA